MPLTPFPRLQQVPVRPIALADQTLKDFSGGLQITDNEFALSTKYATNLVNMIPNPDRSMSVRFGTRVFAATSHTIINQFYFRQHIICILSNGEIEKVDADGNVESIWNTTIAAALPDAPDGWVGSFNADAAEFRGDLIVVNGVDKPIIIDEDLEVSYLVDLASGSNVFTPIARYVTVIGNYVIMAGVPDEETAIFISATGTSGTWPGDQAPNDSTSYDIGAYSGQETSLIVGIFEYKTYLVVFFENTSLLLTIGDFNSNGVHIPDVVDTYADTGTISHNAVIETDRDLIFPTFRGVVSARKNVLGNSLTTRSLSNDLGNTYAAAAADTLRNDARSFAVVDPLSKTIFFSFFRRPRSSAMEGFEPDILPDEENPISNFITYVYAMSYDDDLKKVSWATVRGWAFNSACTTEHGRVFLSDGNNLFQYGNNVFEGEDYQIDYHHHPLRPNGFAIHFEWEMPWIDAGNRVKSKKLHRVKFDTTGTANFLFQCFVDGFYQDPATGELAPALEMPLVAGSEGGYGNNTSGYGRNLYGGGRNTSDERFYGFPLKFRTIKFRFTGEQRKALRVTTMSFIYSRGGYNV